MCGIIALLLSDPAAHVNQALFDGLTVLQHRGQDAAGIVTADNRRLHLRKSNGLVKDVFHTHHMSQLRGNVGLGHVRYPTAGSSSCAEAQPLYTNYPFGICVAHNGNLTNTGELEGLVRDGMMRHDNTESDSELLLNIFAEAMAEQAKSAVTSSKSTTTSSTGSGGSGAALADSITKSEVFAAITRVLTTCEGGYAGIYLINGIGLVAFRDPHGIRPIVLGAKKSGADGGGTVSVNS